MAAERVKAMNRGLRKILLFLLIWLLCIPQVGFAESKGNPWPYFFDIPEDIDGSGVRIALIDTGVSLKYIDESRIAEGKNYVFPDKSTNDLLGHGTALAGMILGSEKLNLKGIAKEAENVPLVYYTRYIAGGISINGGIEAICKAIYDAIDVYDCRIINVSSGVTTDDENLRKAIAYAEEKNVLVVSAVGNTNRSSPEDIYYPAAYDTVVGVGSVDEQKEVASFSQRNASVKLMAPGTNIPTVPITGRTRPVKVSGSSYSAAYVAGVAALLIEANPNLRVSELREILYETAEDLLDEGYDTDTGWGLVNAAKALSEAQKLTALATRDVE
ncbi:MAG: S8 family serine peptidase [Clostridiaceae bacterium]|nr:S8 family serine peptidase [Clostridiaceae bacterium]